MDFPWIDADDGSYVQIRNARLIRWSVKHTVDLVQSFDFPDEHARFDHVEVDLVIEGQRCQFWTWNLCKRVEVQPMNGSIGYTSYCQQSSWSKGFVGDERKHDELETRVEAAHNRRKTSPQNLKRRGFLCAPFAFRYHLPL